MFGSFYKVATRLVESEVWVAQTDFFMPLTSGLPVSYLWRGGAFTPPWFLRGYFHPLFKNLRGYHWIEVEKVATQAYIHTTEWQSFVLGTHWHELFFCGVSVPISGNLIRRETFFPILVGSSDWHSDRMYWEHIYLYSQSCSFSLLCAKVWFLVLRDLVPSFISTLELHLHI